jgi:glycosyltransferase involved in cell wall biosynthesis
VTTSGHEAPHASIVICTRNRADKIATAVGSVLALDYPSFDLTVVDQSTSDDTSAALAPFRDDDRLKYLHFDEAGLSRAYNNGIRNTTSEILAFTDDDCIVPKDWLRNIVDAFAAEPDGELLYGQVDPFESGEGYALTPLLEIPEAQRLGKTAGRFKVFGMGANFAARRRLFERVGYFDQVLGGGAPLRSSQDYDLAYRTYRGGGVILLRPEVRLRHDGRREAEDWPTLLFNYGHGDGAFYTKHVRCLDPLVTWLMLRTFGTALAKWTVKKVIGSNPQDFGYLRGFVAGSRASFRFKVDRRARLYVEP